MAYFSWDSLVPMLSEYEVSQAGRGSRFMKQQWNSKFSPLPTWRYVWVSLSGVLYWKLSILHMDYDQKRKIGDHIGLPNSFICAWVLLICCLLCWIIWIPRVPIGALRLLWLMTKYNMHKLAYAHESNLDDDNDGDSDTEEMGMAGW